MTDLKKTLTMLASCLVLLLTTGAAFAGPAAAGPEEIESGTRVLNFQLGIVDENGCWWHRPVVDSTGEKNSFDVDVPIGSSGSDFWVVPQVNEDCDAPSSYIVFDYTRTGESAFDVKFRYYANIRDLFFGSACESGTRSVEKSASDMTHLGPVDCPVADAATRSVGAQMWTLIAP